VEGKAIFRLIRAKVQHETKIQIVKAKVQHERRFRIAKRAGGRKSDIPPDKSKSAARNEDPNRKANVQRGTKIPYNKAGGWKEKRYSA